MMESASQCCLAEQVPMPCPACHCLQLVNLVGMLWCKETSRNGWMKDSAVIAMTWLNGHWHSFLDFSRSCHKTNKQGLWILIFYITFFGTPTSFSRISRQREEEEGGWNYLIWVVLVLIKTKTSYWCEVLGAFFEPGDFVWVSRIP